VHENKRRLIEPAFFLARSVSASIKKSYA